MDGMIQGILLTVVWVLLMQGEVIAADQSEAHRMAEKEQEMDIKCFEKGIDRLGGHTTAELHSMFTSTKRKAREMGKKFRRRLLRSMFNEEKDDEDPITDTCGKTIFKCDISDVYRTINGSCNNLKHPDWGQINIPMRRFIKPEYDDGIASPRQKNSKDRKLPGAREISTAVFTSTDESAEEKDVTHMVMQFGQFLDHDITSTPIQKGVEGATVTCCEEDVPKSADDDGFNVTFTDRPQCFPIPIPKGDRRFKRKCMNFVRSVQIPNADCKTTPVEQMNQITAYIDASQVYGSTDEESMVLRTLKGGLLNETILSYKKRSLLPENKVKDCVTSEKPNFCFKAGDERGNEQMGLTSMHTIWLREHNRIATKLCEINPHWDDERLYQESRRIVGAMLQHITYNEFLPLVLNSTYITEHNLSPTTGGNYSTLYDASVDPSIRNSFATAAFRFGHSMIRSLFSLINQRLERNDCIQLRNSFGNTSIILSSNGDAVNTLTRGLATDPAKSVDREITPEVIDFLFPDEKGNSMDLMALNIQRGRDHGLPGYNKWRKFCGLSQASSFNVKKGLVDHAKAVAAALKKLYRRPDDIDLFVGGVSERPIPGGIIGPTFACIVAKQFEALKIGDRFWYETSDRVVKFTPGQLQQLHKTSLASVICLNTDTVKIQENVFKKADKQNGNPDKPCRNIPTVNLNKWKEKEVRAVWSTWSPWSPCRKESRTRTRTCNKPRKCPGEKKEKKACQKCKWSGWNKWSKCVKGCKYQTRICSCQSCAGKNKRSKRCGNWKGQRSC